MATYLVQLMHVSIILCALLGSVEAFSGIGARGAGRSSASSLTTLHSEPKRIVVAGASSDVGYIVFKKLLRRKHYNPVGLVPDRKGYDMLRSLGANETQIKVCDVRVRSSLDGLMKDADKCVICVSSKPVKTLIYQAKSLLRKLMRRKIRAPLAHELYYKPKERPYEVDYLGHKNIIDECVKARVKHIVSFGTMGGYRGSRINQVGREDEDDPDVKNGNVIKWKRAAERNLMSRSFFTIIHAATLTDEPGGNREIVWDTDDSLLRTSFRKIPKEDAAEVVVQALGWSEAIGRSIDIASRPPGEGSGPTKDWLRFWSRPGTCIYPGDKDDNLFK